MLDEGRDLERKVELAESKYRDELRKKSPQLWEKIKAEFGDKVCRILQGRQ